MSINSKNDGANQKQGDASKKQQPSKSDQVKENVQKQVNKLIYPK